ncbi:MAG: hypothetical protein UT24_C0003G0077 [Candidatus Woesebacteria bacterium GW2011_GWB1_39_12]|uniref:Uncharacterized protein n=1 Tax=Candidatus Woesebacteria bacterium GW2011_GWB1_39_12 TaxID=1618574 RepID=A0A0G0PU07_9BACT|nr:MAG: hypothetical protein UT24_C0003G0077 [Candidatus Woesebacteria bacterium GW2011_GWB1_39_12]
MVKDLAQQYYWKGLTENYQRLMDRRALWKDVDIIVNREAENVAVEPRLQKLEKIIGEANTRRELNQAKERYAEIPREKLTEPQRLERYDRLGTNLSTIETVMTQTEEEATLLGHRPFITSEEARERNANALLRSARAEGISSAGGSMIGKSNVRYRTNTEPQPFIIREYPVQYDPRSQTWSEVSRFRVYREDTGEFIGQFSERPTARQIRERWRS